MTIAAMYLGSLIMASLSLESMLEWIFSMTDFITIVVHHMMMTMFAAINATPFLTKH